jgi:hypothetical protein
VYYVILTSAAGLYRYDINDVIRVAGFHGKTPLVEFLRKGRDVTNITGEKLHVNHVIQAMEQAQRATGAVVRHFRAFADMENSRYAFMVECDGVKATTQLSAIYSPSWTRAYSSSMSSMPTNENLRDSKRRYFA